MEIRQNSHDIGGLQPDGCRVLSAKFSVPLYHSTVYDLRHPLGIYNVSFDAILENFQSVLNELEVLLAEKPFQDPQSPPSNVLLEKQRNLLYSLMEHMDDCSNILMGFFPTKRDFSESGHVKSYKKSIKEYRKVIGKVVNHLKHKQGVLRSVVLYGDEFACPGYYVEGVDRDGTVGPARHIHKGGNTAFSFSRNLRYHLVNLYVVSRHLTSTINDIVGSKKVSVVPEIKESKDRKVAEVVARVSDLPMMFFPDEVKLPIPSTKFEGKKEEGIEIVLTYPDNNANVQRTPLFAKVCLQIQGDGVSRSFKLLYR